MKLTYDPAVNVAYLRFKDEIVEVETHALSPSVFVDVAPDGSIVGIELLDANAQLKSGDDGHFVFRDPASGQDRTLKVA